MDIRQQKPEFAPITITLHTEEEALDLLAILGHVEDSGELEKLRTIGETRVGMRDLGKICEELCLILGLDDLTARPVYGRIEGNLSWT